MRVRKKGEEAVHEVLEESEKFYICSAHPFNAYLIPKVQCEPVPSETWRDVTGECEACDRDIKHNGVSLICPDGYVLSYYRIRKVQLQEPDSFAGTKYCWAFKVEKREP